MKIVIEVSQNESEFLAFMKMLETLIGGKIHGRNKI